MMEEVVILHIVGPGSFLMQQHEERIRAQYNQPRGNFLCVICNLLRLDDTQCPVCLGQLIPISSQQEFWLEELDAEWDHTHLTSGSSSVIYAARHRATDEMAVIKVLRKAYRRDHARIRRFDRETESLSRMRHPNIVQLMGSGHLCDGRPYMILERLGGRSLESFIRERRVPLESGYAGMDLSLFKSIFKQLCVALAHAHERGVLHWDLTPTSAIINRDNAVKLFDFAKGEPLVHGDNSDQQLTEAGDIFGNVTFLSPEFCWGEDVDNRANIYSLGCIMFFALTTQYPVVGGTWLHTVLCKREEPPDLSAILKDCVPQALVATVMKAMHVEPSQRQQSMRELCSDLEQALARY